MPLRSRLLAGFAALALGLGGVLVVAAPAHAAIDAFEVKNTSGDAAIVDSLPWAVAQAELDGDHSDITFAAGVSGIITLLTPLTITTDITITGPGATVVTVKGKAASASDSVVDISGAGPVAISGLTIAPGAGGSFHGIESTADAIVLRDLSLDGFGDDNLSLDGVSIDASGIVTKNSTHDGFSATTFSGGTIEVSNVTADNNGDAGFVLGSANGTITASGLSATGNGGGMVLLAFSADAVVSDSSFAANVVQGMLIAASDGTVTADGIISTGNGIGAPCGCGGPGIVVQADTDSAVTISRSTVSGNTADTGAGIDLTSLVGGSRVVVSSSTVSGNHAIDNGAGVGGGIAIEKLLDAGSSVSIVDSTISGNDAEDAGGGVYLNDLGSNHAGVSAPTGSVSITRTTIDGNTASYGAGLLLDGTSGTTTGDPALTLRDSTISSNVASEEGGGLYLYQDPANPAASILLTGATVSGNAARGTTGNGNGGGIYVDSPGPTALLELRIEYSTIAANDPPGVGGVFVDGVGVALSLLSSIIAGNDRGDLSFDPAIASFSSLWSIVQDASLAGVPLGATNITGVDPKLGPLANNGGPTKTHLIAPGSPAYNAGDPAFAGAGLFDQRGQARVYQIVDMGAVEWQPALAHTGSTPPAPETPLIGLLLLFAGLAMVAFSRLQLARS